MPITNAFAYLIALGKGSSEILAISSKEIVIEQDKLSLMLTGIFADETDGNYILEKAATRWMT